MSLQQVIAARQAAVQKSEPPQSALVTGAQPALPEQSTQTPPSAETKPSEKEVQLEELAENSFLLDASVRQLVMPGGYMKKGNAQGIVVAENEGELARLKYFEKSNLCKQLR